MSFLHAGESCRAVNGRFEPNRRCSQVSGRVAARLGREATRNFVFFLIWVPRTAKSKSTVSRVAKMERELAISLQHVMALHQKRCAKTHVDVDSDVYPLDKLNQNPSGNPLVNFEAIPLQHAF
jgi:hypothetical protein